MQKVYKVILAGSGAVGKTSLVNRFENGNFLQRYTTTLGAVVTPLVFNTNYGPICLNVWQDASADEKYYTDTDAVIYMFDLTSAESLAAISVYMNTVQKKVGECYSVICGNKYDSPGKKLKITNPGMEYYEISAKSNYNYDKPFLAVCRALTKKPDLRFC